MNHLRHLAFGLVLLAPMGCARGADTSEESVGSVHQAVSTQTAVGDCAFPVLTQGPGTCGAAGSTVMGCSEETWSSGFLASARGDTAIQAFIPADPAYVLHIHENEVITFPDGSTLTGKVNASLNAGSPTGEYASLHTITGGTGRYAGATGYLQYSGTANPAACKYFATVTVP